MFPEEKKIPNIVSDKNYFWRLFEARIKEIDHGGKEVIHLDEYRVKWHVDDLFFHYVICHDLTIRTEDNLRRRYKIYSAGFSGHARRKMFAVMKIAYEHGFRRKETIVPKPLWYDEQIMAVFYIGVGGDNLLEYIKNGYLNEEAIANIARGLKKFHALKVNHAINLLPHYFNLGFLDPTNVLGRPYNQTRELRQDILNQFAKLSALKEKLIQPGEQCLAHGDFHPENVIVNRFDNKQLAFIDFSEVCLAPPYYDIASFLEQLNFMTLEYLNPNVYEKMEKIFLVNYFGAGKIAEEIKNKINLYKAWTALKSAVYFMIFDDEVNENFVRYNLARSAKLIS